MLKDRMNLIGFQDSFLSVLARFECNDDDNYDGAQVIYTNHPNADHF